MFLKSTSKDCCDTQGLYVYMYQGLILAFHKCHLNEPSLTTTMPMALTIPIFFLLAMPCCMWDLCVSTRDWTGTLCFKSMASKPLDCQGSPYTHFLLYPFPCYLSSLSTTNGCLPTAGGWILGYCSRRPWHALREFRVENKCPRKTGGTGLYIELPLHQNLIYWLPTLPLWSSFFF